VGKAPLSETPRRMKKKSQAIDILKRLLKNPAAVIGMCVFFILVILALLAPWIEPYHYAKIDVLNANQGPSLKHLCGTDQLGRDIFSRLLYGSRYSLQIGIWSTLIGTCLGLILGSVAGFSGGMADEIIMRILDVIQSVPGMIMNVALATALGVGFFNCILALSFEAIAGSARMIRASILRIRRMEYVEAAGVLNCSYVVTILRHVLPNAIAPNLVQATMGIGMRITAAAGLAYLGLGVQSPTPEWGAMLAEGRSYISKFPQMTIFPGLLIMITVLSLNLFGDGLRDALDPKLKK
jgi:peptide/nickel transport system permease protein